ncbi:YihY/virulence factor BrkB family protein [Fulvivirga sediminis]|uniref:YihY/virulence factor BrkB family protein n=1 Tax=Fulvivirga sediminis TaxID=2803949 RepID=A0A937F587_9BACT|nr:YihY/virulence factor BrkB family protein [Fulvivirga sediminis]MBL3656000.1 YihY/virulence factor BrkB family protein [Fulvivirga sediminis]
MKIITNWLKLFLSAFKCLRHNQPLLLGSSTAFFTVFSLPPIIIILVGILSLYFKQETLSEQLFNEIQKYFGSGTSKQINNIVQNFRNQASSTWIAIGGSLFLVFVSTTLFHVIRQALNRIWNIRIKTSKKLKYNLTQRLISFVLILVSGILFFGSLVADASVAVLKDYLDQLIPGVDSFIVMTVSYLLSLLSVTLWFAILFKYLPDAKIHGKTAIIGGAFTAILFNLGKYILTQFLVTDNINNIFGTSASVMVLFLFIFYCSMIMYYGAAFTKVYAEEMGDGIQPKKNAELYEITPIES